MGDLGNTEQSIKEQLSDANNTTSDQISTTTSSSKHSVSKGMGGVVSRLNAVIFGSRPPRGFLGQLINNQNARNKQNGISKTTNLSIPDSEYHDVEDIIVMESKSNNRKDHTAIVILPEDSRDADGVSAIPTRETFSGNNQEVYITDETSISQGNNQLKHNSTEETQLAGKLEEVIVVSEGEASTDEQQEFEESDVESEPAEFERVESEPEEEVEDEVEEYDEEDSDSEIGSLNEESDFEVDMEHICDSDCNHSDIESDGEEDSDIEEEEAAFSETNEVVEFTDNENSELEYEEEYEHDDEGEEVFDCDSNCPSDCDGDHHECSSQCGCEIEYSESDSEAEIDNQIEQDIQQDNDRVSPLRKTPPPINGVHKRQASLPETSVLLLQANEVKQAQRKNRFEHNNNKLVVSNSVDLVDELQSAIDARVKRSASHREVPMYRKLSNSSLDESRKVGPGEREAWRKDRRARLRTLELKREQILDEVRDGTTDRVNDAMYSSEVSV